jgi:8-oxo-dGTP pyrophosphatase MutT (NUDIX family)
VLFRILAGIYNALPIRWQRRLLDRTQHRFLVGVAGLGVDTDGRVLLARHRFGAPQWRFLGGFVDVRERIEDALAREIREETGLEIEVGPILEAIPGYRWQRIELVYAYRPSGGAQRLSDEVIELRAFDPADLPDMRADQRGMIERHASRAVEWARQRA